MFILATTEVHKLPATILSRCMRFDFRLVPLDKLAALIAGVYAEEGKEAEDEAIRYIAEAGEGSVRDALSVADMCLNYSDGKLTYADCLDVLGATDRGKLHSLFDAIVRADFGACLEAVDELAGLGKSMSLIARDLTRYARDLLVAKTGSTRLIVDTPENIEAMKTAAEQCSVDLLVSVIQIFSAIDTELRYSVSPRIVLETACVRAVKLGTTDIAALEERLCRLEKGGVSAPARPAAAEPAAAPSRRRPRRRHGVGQTHDLYAHQRDHAAVFAHRRTHRFFAGRKHAGDRRGGGGVSGIFRSRYADDDPAGARRYGT